MSVAWLREVSPEARRALFGAASGWMLDAMDVMLYAFALTAIRAEFGLDAAEAGLLASVTLVASAVGVRYPLRLTACAIVSSSTRVSMPPCAWPAHP